MKQKRVLILFFILALLLVMLPVIYAQDENDEDETDIDKAYSCLKDKLESNCGDTRNTEQAAFSLLAMAHESSIQSDCKSSLQDKEKSDCWGETETSSCNIKSTALAVLALNHIGVNIDDSIDWLIEKRKIAEDLDWFLEIDANNETECKIKVAGGSENTFSITENKKISGSSSCLSPAEQNYFLKVDDSCLGKNFTINCNEDFITTVFYKKSGENTYHVSSETHSAQAGDSTKEKVDAYCFAISNTCDYEGSLWATLALAKAREDISPYLPYISAMSNEAANKKYLPLTFLYMLTNEDDYLYELIDLQKQGSYWDESGSKLYDTALALLALQNVNVDAIDGTQGYLSSIQDDSGCWGTTSNTAFLLYALNPREPISIAPSRADCEVNNYNCVSTGDCSLENELENFYCPSLSEVCCSVRPDEETCDEKEGIVCESGQRCSIPEVPALDTSNCCLGSCQVVVESECEQFYYSCEVSCTGSEEEKTSYSNSCGAGEICCGEKSKEGGNLMLIVLLIILILLVILAILFRNQLKTWLFRFKGKVKFGKGPKPTYRPSGPSPGVPPQPSGRMPVRRHALRRPPVRRPRPSRPSEREKDFDETMKKLKEMSK